MKTQTNLPVKICHLKVYHADVTRHDTSTSIEYVRLCGIQCCTHCGIENLLFKFFWKISSKTQTVYLPCQMHVHALTVSSTNPIINKQFLPARLLRSPRLAVGYHSSILLIIIHTHTHTGTQSALPLSLVRLRLEA